FADLVHPDDRGRLERLLERRHATASRPVEIRIAAPDGDVRYVMAMRGPDLAEAKSGQAIGMVRDVSADKAIERQLAAAYSYDSLTALPNRTLFMDRLAEAVRVAQTKEERVALIVCDID